MNPIKITRTLSKKAAWTFTGKAAFVAFGLYGMVTSYNNFTSFSARTYENFIVEQAVARNIVQTKTEIQYVVDPKEQAKAIDAAAEKVSNAATEGAKKGSQETLTKALGK